VRAEAVDVKEGTTGGLIEGNRFDGHGMVMSKDWVDSWLEIKGNGYLVRANRGTYSLRHGFEAYSVLTGWGSGNTFVDNVADVQGPGYGFKIGSGTTNTVKCANTVTNAGSGASNVGCQ
jgi:hypothetical protein